MKSPFHVGDRVRFSLGRGKLKGIIAEDRGPLGIGGRHIYQILVSMDPSEFELAKFELQEDEIEPDDQGAQGSKRPLDPSKVIAYLKHGGLIAILRRNHQGGKNQPRVWLGLDSLGNVTHTFIEERGQAGGQIIPFLASVGDHIFLPKADEVREFLVSFGLSDKQAAEVISSVGTFPQRPITPA